MNGFYTITVLIVGAILGVMTVRRLWRRGRNPWERMVYDEGVRRIGIGAAVFFPILFPVVLMRTERPWFEIALVAAWLLIVGLPMWLWAGYWWGRTMAAYFKITKTSDTNNAAPPVA